MRSAIKELAIGAAEADARELSGLLNGELPEERCGTRYPAFSGRKIGLCPATIRTFGRVASFPDATHRPHNDATASPRRFAAVATSDCLRWMVQEG